MSHKPEIWTGHMDWETALENLSLSTDVTRWYNGIGEDVLRRVGIRNGDKVLDFGCRVGHYTIPAARVVGPEGLVYAIDKNHNAIDELERRADSLQLAEIIRTMRTDGALRIALPDNSTDFVLFFDVIRSLLDIDETLNPIKTLLVEFQRILVRNGILSVYVKHLEDTKFSLSDISSLLRESFSLESVLTAKVMHWNYLEDDTVQIYRLR